ncbi:anthranilate synthase component II [Flexithrix dorotheae]|uniref:anthranilate synthase component II n=1 Tax=Flexithrix dorotheae TaxID=70993 RepID=UPI000374F336|nr:aminodeoxychorismate/anthranilate synthase component II [Flexithrix dorotheae]
MKLLILDNYDSFTYNLVHLIKELGYAPVVKRNDKISLESVGEFDKILLSPGPGIPVEAGIMMDLIKQYAPTKSIMGVCLGHQGIGESFGANLINMDLVYHGIVSETQVLDEEEILFKKVPKVFNTCRYHSWVVDPKELPEDLVITATNEEGRIMGLRHKKYDVRGVQFHPESFLTENGATIMKNWLEA